MNHLIDNGKKYLYTGIIILVITVFIHISNGSVKQELLDYIAMEPNFSITDEITEASTLDLVYGDEILLLHDEVVIRGEIVMWLYITTAVLVVAGGSGLYLENRKTK